MVWYFQIVHFDAANGFWLAPLALGGQILMDHTADSKSIGIEQIQLEQVCSYQVDLSVSNSFKKDTAKSTLEPRSGSIAIDINRAGSALMEIVSRPDMRYEI